MICQFSICFHCSTLKPHTLFLPHNEASDLWPHLPSSKTAALSVKRLNQGFVIAATVHSSCLVLHTCSIIHHHPHSHPLSSPFPYPADLYNYTFLESRSNHRFNHLHPQCTLLWFNKHRTKKHLLILRLLLSFSHTHTETLTEAFPEWPLHLVGMFHTPANCLQTSVSHLWAPGESSQASFFDLTNSLWHCRTGGEFVWAAYSHIQSEVQQRYEAVRWYLWSDCVWVTKLWLTAFVRVLMGVPLKSSVLVCPPTSRGVEWQIAKGSVSIWPGTYWTILWPRLVKESSQ